MAEFSKLVITAKGQALIAKMIAGVGNIELPKFPRPAPPTPCRSWKPSPPFPT